MQDHLLFTGYLGKRLHLGVTGSIAAYKSLDLVRDLTRTGVSVGATLTESASRFITGLSFRGVGCDPVYESMFGASGEKFGHLEPGFNAQALVIAPATANIIAKLAMGLADDMLSCQALAFDGPLIVAPAMNHRMWLAKATQANWKTLLGRGVIGIGPEQGPMACGETGPGRLARLEHIYLAALKAVTPQDLAGQKVLVCLGPTREAWDPVRYLSNPSSGKMGASLAVAAYLRGADVTAVCGPGDLWLPPEIRRKDVVSAGQMGKACMDAWPRMDMAFMAAAVSDFSPVPRAKGKFKKESLKGGDLEIRFKLNPDILLEMSRIKKKKQKLVGFAAETGDLKKNAGKKLSAKNLDLVAGNLIGAKDSGFAVSTNRMLVMDAKGREETWPVLPKTEIAWRLLDWVSDL